MIGVADKEMAPRQLPLPGARPTVTKGASVDEKNLAPRAGYVLYRVHPDGTEDLVSQHPDFARAGKPERTPSPLWTRRTATASTIAGPYRRVRTQPPDASVRSGAGDSGGGCAVE